MGKLSFLRKDLILGIFYRDKQKNNAKLNKSNERLVDANEELHQQKDEIISQRDAIEQQNEMLHLANRKINQSIKAAQMIQKAALPFEEELHTHLRDYFVLHHPRPRQFATKSFVFEPGTLLYLGSDGFADQNNVQHRCFGNEALKQLIYTHHTRLLSKQRQILENALTQYIEGTEQRDDILLLGVKL